MSEFGLGWKRKGESDKGVEGKGFCIFRCFCTDGFVKKYLG